MQCLPSNPQWDHYQDGNYGGYRAHIFGTEIDLPSASHYFSRDVDEQDMPCAVCRTPRATVLMIPARTSCYAGWTQEYHGYLMAGAYDGDGAYNHICMDRYPEFLQHGASDDNQNVVYLVEAQCGSLPCPPYYDGRELACVVCSR